MDPIPEHACDTAYELSQSLVYKGILYAKIATSVVGVILTFHLIYAKRLRWLVHPNAKVIYSFHLYLSLHITFFFAVSYIYDLIRLEVYKPNKCSYTISLTVIYIIRGIPTVAISVQAFAIFLFALERAVSTVFPLQYESIKNPNAAAALVAFLTVLIVAANYYLVFLHGHGKADEYKAVLNLRNEYNSSNFQILLYTWIVLEVLALILFLICLLRNNSFRNKLAETKSNLRIRYQVSENRRIIRVLLPCFLLHTLINVASTLIVALYHPLISETDVIGFDIWLEAFGQYQLYSIFMPPLVLRALKKYSKSVVDRTDGLDAYFKSLNKVFA